MPSQTSAASAVVGEVKGIGAETTPVKASDVAVSRPMKRRFLSVFLGSIKLSINEQRFAVNGI